MAKKEDIKAKKKKGKVNDFYVESSLAFYCKDGGVYYCLKDLSNALEKMAKEIFEHHTNKERNDFSNWINGVFKFDKLAEGVKKSKTAKAMKNKIDSALN